MSESDSDSETETQRTSRCRRRLEVKSRHSSSASSCSGDSDSSSTDESMIVKRNNRKQKRMISTSEDDDSGSEPQVIKFATAKKMLYEGVDSDSSWSPSFEPVASTSSGRFRVSNSANRPSTSSAPVAGPSSRVNAAAAADEAAAGFSSDTSDDATEKCPICLHSFREQETGTPNTCDHTYCRICIEEWSRNVQTCPIDRQLFTSITVRSRYDNGGFVRSIAVEASGTELTVDDEDLTQCEVCHQTDREDRMLLCDECNKGFHMDCLSPALDEIPENSWYCDCCFFSDATSDDEDDLNQLITEMEMEVGVPETRFRVRRVEDTPRIPRTRQSERIRAAIISRIQPTRRATGTGTAARAESAPGMAGSSRRISTYTRTTRTTTRTRTTTTRSSRKRRVRKSKRSSRTYVVEYDVEGESKFPLTTKKVIKRKRKTVKGKKSKQRKSSGRRCGGTRSSANRNDDTAAASSSATGSAGTRGSGGAYPSLHLFGNPNAFDYFSDDEAMDLSDENAGRGLGGHDGGAMLSATLTRTRIGGSTLRRQKGIVSALDASGPAAGAVDVLSNIMDTMDRWHEMTQPRSLEKIQIDSEGKLTFAGKSGKSVKDKKNEIESSVQNAPVYPRNGGGGAGVGGYNNQNNSNFQRSGGYRGSGGGGSGNNGHSGGNDSNTTASSSGMSFSIFGPRNTNSSHPGGSGGIGSTNNSFNEFSSPRFPPNNPNRRNQPPNQQANHNFRARNASPFNQSPQFPNRNFGTNNFASNAQPPLGGGGLYDDPQMPPPVANSAPMINSLQMQTPPPQLPPTNAALQQLHMSTPPPPFHPAMNIAPPMMAIPPPFVAPQFIAPPPMNMFTDAHPVASYPQPTETVHESTSEYDPTIESEDPEPTDEADQEVSLDIPLPTVAPATTKPSAGLSGLANYDSDEDDNDCPNFSVYSTVSMNVARNLETDNLKVYGPENKPESDNDGLEQDEDLVQLDDDDEDEADADEEVVNSQKETSNTIDEDVDKDKSLMAKKNVLDLHDDSDWDELNNEKSDESAVSKKIGEDDDNDGKSTQEDDHQRDSDEENDAPDDRSFTPCLDEQVPGGSDKSGDLDPDTKSDDDDDKSDEDHDDESNRAGIAGMQTELISDDESEDILNGKSPGDRSKSNRDKSGKTSKKTGDKRKDTDDPKKRVDKDKGKHRKSEKEESFKKISRSNKDRNYRDKNYDKRRRRRSSSRSRSRSRSNNKENRGRLRDSFRRRDTKRQDIERYDVRNVIADRQPRSYKDKYGRDTSRPRSRSLTRRRRSNSGSVSPGKRRSHSRPPRRSPRRRSPVRRSSQSPVNRKRSRSPLARDRSPHKSRLLVNGKSSNHSARSVSPRPRHSRSSSPRERNRKKNLKRKTKKRKISPDPMDHKGKKSAAGQDNELLRSQSWDQEDKRTSWENNDKLSPWSRSPTPAVGDNDPSSSWTPPQSASGQHGHGFTVILKNKESKRKKEKKQRKSEKRKESSGLREKRERRKRDKHGGGVSSQTGAGSSHQSTAPSKEVFASGDNILVSVSFNKDAANKTQQTTIVTLPPSKDQIVSKKQSSDAAPPARRNKRTSTSTSTVRKHKKINLKPVAIIDLDRSPFKEITPSPKAIIVLTDSDREEDDAAAARNANHPSAIMIDTHTGIIDHGDDVHNVEQVSQPQSPTMEDFEIANSSGGPKTPPEPPVVKFSLPLKSKNKLRNVNNPLHDAIEEEQQVLIQQQQQASGQISEPDEDVDGGNDIGTGECSEPMVVVPLNKVGPNTPPGPRSPDAYDPFEPTKSGSVSPDHNADHQGHSSSGDSNDDDDRTESHTPDLPPTINNDIDKNDKSVKPVDLAMALINSKASLDAANSFLSSSLEGGVDASDNPSIQCIDDDDEYDDDVQIVASTSGVEKQPIQVLSNVRLNNSSRVPTGAQGVGVTYLTKAALKATTSSPIRPSKGSGLSLLSKLPIPKPVGPKPSTSTSRHNGGSMDADGGADTTIGHESPYSPDSSDYDDLFEPPPASPSQKKGAKSKAAYENLFEASTSPNSKFGRNKKSRARKPSVATKAAKPTSTIPSQTVTAAQSRLTEDQMRLFDDVPNSAVEMLVKDKYLRKLNRQERVVEEVKLVLKPHYYKKRISKDDYKDILRRSVPKICHNRTGEINPQKIKNLVEAYVKKFRHRRKPVGGASALDGTAKV